MSSYGFRISKSYRDSRSNSKITYLCRFALKRLTLISCLLIGGGGFSAYSWAKPAIQGTASVIDGDTIEIRGKRIRLDAIDAPESSQLCLDAACKRYRCEQRSAFALADMISRGLVRCEPKGHDRYGRTIAVCFKGGTSLNAWMVAQGWAVAYRKYGIDYIPQEDEARLARRGMWNGSFEMSWDWRARNR